MSNDSQSNEKYRNILVTASKLETIQGNLETVIDLFLTPIVKLYTKLCDDSLKLLFEGEFKLDQFRKVEELIWRRIYHDVYRIYKTKRQRFRRLEESLVESHFISGIGFYSGLIVKLRLRFKVHGSHGVIPPLNYSSGAMNGLEPSWKGLIDDGLDAATDDEDSEWVSHKQGSSSQAKEWANHAIYRSLVYMGDLARYLIETSDFDYRRLACRFYKSASRNQPQYGLPFNQLATLAGSANHNLDAVCNYIRCAMKPKPFDGVEGNLRKIFDINKRAYEDLHRHKWTSKSSDVTASSDPVAAAWYLVKRLIVVFIELTSDIWSIASITGETLNYDSIVSKTQEFFECLCEAIDLDTLIPLSEHDNVERKFSPFSIGLGSEARPKFVSSTVMFEFCSISIMLIAKSRTAGLNSIDASLSQDVSLPSLVDTLALNLLHYSTSKCQRMILHKIQEMRVFSSDKGVTPKSEVSSCLIESRGNLSSESQKSFENAITPIEHSTRRTLSRIRQRKAASTYSSAMLNRVKPQVIPPDESELSELEETALSTIDALDISSEMSEGEDFQTDDLIDLSSSEDIGYKLSRSRLRPTQSQTYASKSSKLAASLNSLPMPDLITGDNAIEQFSGKASDKSHSPEEDVTSGFKSPQDSDRITRFSSELVLSHIYSQTYLPTIKIYCDWLLSSSEVIKSNLTSFEAFCFELEALVTNLDELFQLLDFSQESLSTVYSHVHNGPTWIQRYPLTCDYPMVNIEPLRKVHELNIKFDLEELTDAESGFIAAQCTKAFLSALQAFFYCPQ